MRATAKRPHLESANRRARSRSPLCHRSRGKNDRLLPAVSSQEPIHANPVATAKPPAGGNHPHQAAMPSFAKLPISESARHTSPLSPRHRIHYTNDPPRHAHRHAAARRPVGKPSSLIQPLKAHMKTAI